MDDLKGKPKVREKTLKYGLQYPVDEELIMLILGSGSKDMNVEVMAKRINETLDSCNEEEMVQKLVGLKGIGTGKALAVAAAIELGKRRTCHLGAHITTPDSIFPYVKNYAIYSQEHFLVITLNGGHNIMNIHVVSLGTVNRTLIHPREVFVDAIREKATAIIVCHNHPSGNSEPSDADLETTKTLVKASKIIGIPILDHIIFNCQGYFSFLEHGLLLSDED